MTTRPLRESDYGTNILIPYLGYIEVGAIFHKEKILSFGEPFRAKIIQNSGYNFTTKERNYDLTRQIGNYHLLLS